MRIRLTLTFLLLIAPIAHSQFPATPEKPPGDSVGRLQYIREYNWAIQALAKKNPCDPALSRQAGRFGMGINFLTDWPDKEIEARREMFDKLLKDARAISGANAKTQ